jgi:DNA-binding response OmpR family regulator
MKTAKVLLVEDDSNLGFVIKDHLEFREYAVTLCTDGDAAWKLFQETEFDICVLDIMLPGKSGLELIKLIRSVNEYIPVLFISARSLSEDKIHGLTLGADDYIIKPFSIEELVLRMEVFLRRIKKLSLVKDTYIIGNYQFNYKDQLLIHTLGSVKLTKKEADILKFFCSNINITVKREDILNLIWGDDDYFMGRSLDVYISRIRRYLKYDTSIELANIFAVGFRLTIKV